ncbi:MAG TPA: VOC family protein [Actinomycetota bacterium]|nr:VOC family protein [Actinomycetota bacterium]
MLGIDHVAYAVGDLDDAAVRFRDEFGLDSIEGGRHERWGTANRIVPLGDQYLELVAAVDPSTAAGAGFGRGVLEHAEGGGGWFTIAAVTDDLDAVASHLGLEVVAGSRRRPDGEAVRWRMAGLDDPRREPWMPFFLTWDIPDELHPGRTRAGHGVRAGGIAWVEVGGDAERLRDWLGGEELPIRVNDGPPGVHRIAISTADGELVIEG